MSDVSARAGSAHRVSRCEMSENKQFQRCLRVGRVLPVDRACSTPMLTYRPPRVVDCDCVRDRVNAHPDHVTHARDFDYVPLSGDLMS